MLSIVIRILSAIFLVWLFRRLMGVFLGSAKASRPKEDTAAALNHMVKDPVCGMYMDSRLALRLENRREEFYFCSEDCKNKYLNQSSSTAGDSAHR
jgi:uncharacterized protein